MTRSGFSMQWIETTIISRGDEFRAWSREKPRCPSLPFV